MLTEDQVFEGPSTGKNISMPKPMLDALLDRVRVERRPLSRICKDAFLLYLISVGVVKAQQTQSDQAQG